MFNPITDNQDAVVDDTYLIEKLGLTKSFINRHSRAMGAFKRKPRLFLLKNVLDHIEFLAQQSIQRAGVKELKKAATRREVNQLFELVVRKRSLKKGGDENGKRGLMRLGRG